MPGQPMNFWLHFGNTTLYRHRLAPEPGSFRFYDAQHLVIQYPLKPVPHGLLCPIGTPGRVIPQAVTQRFFDTFTSNFDSSEILSSMSKFDVEIKHFEKISTTLSFSNNRSGIQKLGLKGQTRAEGAEIFALFFSP